MRAPCGLIEIVQLYGDPASYVRDDGTVSPLWEQRMVKVAFPGPPLPLGWRPVVTVQAARVNQAIAAEVEATLKVIEKQGFWKELRTFDGAYTWRPSRTSKKLSMHGFGGALDFNANSNELGTKGDMHQGIVDIFEGRGWEWGGRWQRPDPMHFQFARGY